MSYDLSTVTTSVVSMSLFVAMIGHFMAIIWFIAVTHDWRISRRLIYDMPIPRAQLVRELKNSVHTPLHAVILLGCASLNFFSAGTITSFFTSLIVTFIWAEVWHYFSHRAFHTKHLHWIHVEHHRSHINTPFTAVSFSFAEKLIFDIGIIVPLLAIDAYVTPLNFYGVSSWFAGYLIVNSFSHANYEFRPSGYNKVIGRFATTTTYHSLHHSRYVGNYGLGTRFLDRIFATEWSDYEQVYTRVTKEKRPLRKLREKLDAA